MKYLLIFAIMLGTGCARITKVPTDQSDDHACTMLYGYGLYINVKYPAGTAVSGFEVKIEEGSYSEDAFDTGPGPSGGEGFLGAGERPGTYKITVSHPDFSTQVRNNVVVQSDGCHPIPVTVNFQF